MRLPGVKPVVACILALLILGGGIFGAASCDTRAGIPTGPDIRQTAFPGGEWCSLAPHKELKDYSHVFRI